MTTRQIRIYAALMDGIKEELGSLESTLSCWSNKGIFPWAIKKIGHLKKAAPIMRQLSLNVNLIETSIHYLSEDS